MIILTILILPIQEHGISFYLFVSSSISFISALEFSEYRSFASSGRCIPRYYILFDVMVNGIIFSISLSDSLLLVYRTATDFCILMKRSQRRQSSGKCKSKPQWDTTSHLSEWLSSERTQITNVGKDVEKRGLLYTVGRSVDSCSHYGKQYSIFSKKLKIELPYDLVIPLLGIYLKKKKQH